MTVYAQGKSIKYMCHEKKHYGKICGKTNEGWIVEVLVPTPDLTYEYSHTVVPEENILPTEDRDKKPPEYTIEQVLEYAKSRDEATKEFRESWGHRTDMTFTLMQELINKHKDPNEAIKNYVLSKIRLASTPKLDCGLDYSYLKKFLIDMPLEDLPLHISDINRKIREIVLWRLLIGV